MIDEELMRQLGKEAAYRKARIAPPKKSVSRSRRMKLRTEKDKDDAKKASRSPSGNAQPPFRYGRRLK